MTYRQRVANRLRWDRIDARKSRDDTNPLHSVQAMTPGIVVLALVLAVAVSIDARASTSFQVTREGWISEVSTDQPASYAQMQFNDWNTQLPGDTGDQGLKTEVMSSAKLRFHEENVWLPGDTNGLGLLSSGQ